MYPKWKWWNILSLENVFVKKRIKYNYDEYLEHLKSTKGYKNKNYQLTSDYKTFKNINISIFKNKYVIISKSSSNSNFPDINSFP